MNTCSICGIESREVVIRLIHWTDPEERPEYSADPRCADSKACRERLERNGESWPVVEVRVVA